MVSGYIGHNFAMRRSRFLGFDSWLLCLGVLATIPNADRLYLAMVVLALAMLLCRFILGYTDKEVTTLHTGLVTMVALSTTLPLIKVTPWWSMSFVAAVGLASWWVEKKISRWTVFLVWVLCIGLVSGGAGGANGWSDWLALLLGITSKQAEMLVVDLRKFIHFTYYGTMAVLAYRHLIGTREEVRTATLGAAGLGISIAAFDETRQLFTPFRSGSLTDWLLDFFGIVCCLAAYRYFSRRRSASRA